MIVGTAAEHVVAGRGRRHITGDRLHDFVDGVLPAGEESMHLMTCERCAGYLEELFTVVRVLRTECLDPAR